MMIVSAIIQQISKSMPNLGSKLKQAGIKYSPNEFIKRNLLFSVYVSLSIGIFLFLFLPKLGNFTNLIILSVPVIYIVSFFYMLRMPDVLIIKKQREIDSEIVFAGRFLIIELESGVPLYDAFNNIIKNYAAIGKHFSEIITKIDFGTEIEEALNEEIAITPAPNFRKILWQIVNSQHTGADMSTSLKSVVDNIAKEQIIEIKEYGRKLNPLAMFYMMIAVILPSIGITMFIVLSTFLNLKLDLTILLTVSFALAFMQFMFLAMIKSSRPAMGI